MPLTTTGSRATPTLPTRGRLRPLGLTDVRIVGGFWAARQEINAGASLAHIEHWMERVGWIGNFDRAVSGQLPEGRRGKEFADSEVYKLLEAMSWEIGRDDDPALEERFRRLVRRVAAAQEGDGYLNTAFGRPGQPSRWTDLEWGHELYCVGHLVQAGVARARTRPEADDGLLAVARRAADLVCEVFADTGIRSVCGHPVIETALVELARVTDESRYIDQAALFVERRGHGTLEDIEWGRAYYQDDIPVREATVLRGHAVRAGYLAAGAVDVAVETGDAELLRALTTQWANTVARRTYLTGGQGAHHQTEGFGDDWALPPDRAYSETCAAVGSVMFSWRLLLAVGEPQYADVIERTLYNVIATSPSPEGTAFYYANTLHQRRPGVTPAPDEVCPRASSSLRAPWFAVSCCPPNVARTLASLAAYIATVDDAGLQLHQYAPAQIRTVLPDGRPIALDVETSYPAQGTVRVIIREKSGGPWMLTLRVPAWAKGAVLREIPVGEPVIERDAPVGAVEVTRSFQVGDVVELHLPVGPRFTEADARIDAVRGCVAVERGPEVMCLESVDLEMARGGRPSDVGMVEVDRTIAPRDEDGRVTVTLAVHAERQDAHWPYPDGRPSDRAEPERLSVALVPYHDWANRGPSTMRVWLPTRTPR